MIELRRTNPLNNSTPNLIYFTVRCGWRRLYRAVTAMLSRTGYHRKVVYTQYYIMLYNNNIYVIYTYIYFRYNRNRETTVILLHKKVTIFIPESRCRRRRSCSKRNPLARRPPYSLRVERERKMPVA